MQSIVINNTEGAEVLALFQTTKEQRAVRVSAIIEAVEEGLVNALEVHLQAKCAEEQIKLLLSNERFKGIVLEEAQKHGKAFDLHNAKWQVKEAGTTYDYAVCNDPVITDLLARKAELDDRVKARQKFLQGIPDEGAILTDGETGETTRVYRPAKLSTTTVAVTLK